jgi:dipeptidase
VHAGGTVASSQSVASWVADLRGGSGGRRGVQHWATATSGPCTSLFKPVAVDQPVDLGADATNRYDPGTTWWRHEDLHRAALRDLSASLARFGAERDRTEQRWLAEPPPSAQAFAEAAELAGRWADELRRAQLPDVRPRWVRSQWKRFDQEARRP